MVAIQLTYQTIILLKLYLYLIEYCVLHVIQNCEFGPTYDHDIPNKVMAFFMHFFGWKNDQRVNHAPLWAF